MRKALRKIHTRAAVNERFMMPADRAGCGRRAANPKTNQCSAQNRTAISSSSGSAAAPAITISRADDARRRSRWLESLAALFSDVDPRLAVARVKRRHIGIRWRPARRARRCVGTQRLDMRPRRAVTLRRPCGMPRALRQLWGRDAGRSAKLRSGFAWCRTHPLLVGPHRLQGFQRRAIDRGKRAGSLIERAERLARRRAPGAVAFDSARRATNP